MSMSMSNTESLVIPMWSPISIQAQSRSQVNQTVSLRSLTKTTSDIIPQHGKLLIMMNKKRKKIMNMMMMMMNDKNWWEIWRQADERFDLMLDVNCQYNCQLSIVNTSWSDRSLTYLHWQKIHMKVIMSFLLKTSYDADADGNDVELCHFQME